MDVTLYYHSTCGTSRRVLELLRENGIEPRVVEYVKEPPSRAGWGSLMRRGISIDALMRKKEPLYTELQLERASDQELLDALTAHPQLLNRPVVVTEHAVRVCRPAETVLEML